MGALLKTLSQFLYFGRIDCCDHFRFRFAPKRRGSLVFVCGFRLMVSWKNERDSLTAVQTGLPNGFGRDFTALVGTDDAVYPSRYRFGQGINVGGEWCIVREVPTCLVTDDVDDGSACPACIVQIGNSVCKTWTQVQQSDCRFTGHSSITVSGTSTNILLKPNDATH